MIIISKNDPNDLRESTKNHIDDVIEGMQLFSNMMIEAAQNHDNTKVQKFEEFSKALASGKIRDSEWYNYHITSERHHLFDHVPDDVNLIDVFEHLIDCVVAGLARNGNVYDINLPTDVLERAHKNTIKLLMNNIDDITNITL